MLRAARRQLERLERAIDAGAAALPPRRALRPRPDAGRAVPPALRRHARGARAARRSRDGVGATRRRPSTRRGATSARPSPRRARTRRRGPPARRAPPAGASSTARSRWARTARRSSRSGETGRGRRRREAVVLASGNLGLVYLPDSDERMTLEQIDAAHPRPGGGARRASRHRLRDGPLRARRAGRDRGERAGGGSPTTASRARIRSRRFGANAAAHLRRHRQLSRTARTSWSTACTTRRRTRSRRSRSSWARTAASAAPRATRSRSSRAAGAPSRTPIVGVEAMHGVLRTWLAETGLEVEAHREKRTAAPAGG